MGGVSGRPATPTTLIGPEAEVAADLPEVPLCRDLRLWAAPVLFGGIAAVANLAWGTFLPGRGAATWVVALAAAVLALALVGVALHPRSRRWTAEGHVVPSITAVFLAFAVAPPAEGPRLLIFLWTAVLLMFLWSKARGLVRSAVRMTLVLPKDGSGGAGEAAPPVPEGRAAPGRMLWWQRRGSLVGGSGPLGPGVGRAMLDALVAVATLTAVCDLGAGARSTLASGAARTLAATLGGAALLALAAWTGRADALRQAAAEDVGVQHGFSRMWWWAVAPVVGACLAIGLLLPTFPAPLQGGTLSHLALGYAAFLTGFAGPPLPPYIPTAAQVHAQNTTGLILAGLCLGGLILSWPLRRPVERALRRAAGIVEPGPELRLTLPERLRLWWARTVEAWLGLLGRRRRPPTRHGTWRPMGRADASTGRTADPRGPGAHTIPDDHRGRVRAAYGNILGEARQAGFGRRAADTPRRFLGWLVPRAQSARFPLESLTAAYELARYSRRTVAVEDAERAEGDARAAAYGLQVAVAEQRRRAGQPAPDPALKWTAPRGVRWRE